jgi:hypothetical protein
VLDLAGPEDWVPAVLTLCVHCGEAQGDLEACVHRMLYCSTVQSRCGRVSLSGLWPKLNWEAPAGSNLVYSILSPEWNADKTRVDKVRYWTAVAPHSRRIDLYRSRSVEEAGSGHEDSSHVGCLAGFVWSQVTPGLSMSMRIRRYVKSTYIHGVYVDIVFNLGSRVQAAWRLHHGVSFTPNTAQCSATA